MDMKAKHREYMREYYRRFPEKRRAKRKLDRSSGRRTYQTKAARIRHILASSRRRAKDAGLSHDLTREQLLELWEQQAGVCALTGWPFDLTYAKATKHNPKAPSLDQIEPQGGYTLGNVRLVCYQANMALNQWRDAQLVEFCKAVLKHGGYR